mmetsp:Transcript_19306/g.39688  ORF Transcript_19306/g.39688 Transcript_19306/m.39688 type:complete len:274 (-) Transcript_19306:1217-2038(-)
MFPCHHYEHMGSGWKHVQKFPASRVEVSYQPTVCQNRNDSNDVKDLFPNTNSASSFRERTTPHFANFVSIKSHTQKVIDENQKGDARQNKAEASYKGKLYHRSNILRETIMGRTHDFHPEFVLRLIQQNTFVDQSDLSNLDIAAFVLLIIFCEKFDPLQLFAKAFAIKVMPNVANAHKDIDLQDDIPPVCNRCVDHETRKHPDHSVVKRIWRIDCRSHESVVIHCSKLTNKAKPKYFDNQRRSIFCVRPIVFKVIESHRKIHENDIQNRDTQS